MARQVTIVALAMTALAVSGCASSKPSDALSQAELTKKANAICNRLRTQITAADTRSAKEPAQLFSQTAGYEQTTQAELQKLKPPASLASDWKQIVTTMGVLARDSTKYSEYFKAKNMTRAHALSSSYSSLKIHTLATAKRDGLTTCVL